MKQVKKSKNVKNTIVYGDTCSRSRCPIVERKSTSICVSEKLEKKINKTKKKKKKNMSTNFDVETVLYLKSFDTFLD